MLSNLRGNNPFFPSLDKSRIYKILKAEGPDTLRDLCHSQQQSSTQHISTDLLTLSLTLFDATKEIHFITSCCNEVSNLQSAAVVIKEKLHFTVNVALYADNSCKYTEDKTSRLSSLSQNMLTITPSENNQR